MRRGGPQQSISISAKHMPDLRKESSCFIMGDSALRFYNQLASNYHLLFPDWKKAVVKQGEFLDGFIRHHLGKRPSSVLDCTCGIGTQSIGLALHGYEVHAMDISSVAVERAVREARMFGVPLICSVADLRASSIQIDGLFDVVISCDNSLPHLLSNEELLRAASHMWSKLRAGGMLVVSIRDYDRILEQRLRSTMPSVFDDPVWRRIIFQVWDWLDDEHTYAVHLFILKEAEKPWEVLHYVTEYRALLRSELSEILRKAGFSEICWHMPNGSWDTSSPSGYYQPIVTAHRN